ncbi:AAA family ATPase [Nonomuraea sp. NPDC051941]|uniref:AAA family ATPase n=1 Tax=Nonomuraea sp. NPDC051941 TaxID=3364373 RepID=UPI0037C6F4BF
MVAGLSAPQPGMASGYGARINGIGLVAFPATAAPTRHELVHAHRPVAGAQQTARCRVGPAGRTVLAGSATEFERLVPFGVYVDAFTRLADEQGGHVDGGRPGGLAESALRTLLSAGETSDTVRGRLDRFHAYRGIRALLIHLATGRGAVLALDDLHWADAPSLELTEFLLRNPPAAGFLPAIACRSTMIPPAVADAVACQDAYITRLSLSPLDEEAAAAYRPTPAPGPGG